MKWLEALNYGKNLTSCISKLLSNDTFSKQLDRMGGFIALIISGIEIAQKIKDEMMVNIKGTQKTGVGFYDWAWSIISPQTRFVLAVEISKRHETEDARSILAKGKENAKGQTPSYLISDSLMSYRDAFMKELDARKTLHIKTNAIRDGFQNRPIERYHNEIRA